MNNIYLPVQNVVISTLQTSNASMNVPGTASFRKVPHPCKHALFQPLLRNNPMLKMRFLLNKSSPYWIIIMIPPFPHSVHCNHFRVQAIGSYYHFLIRYLSQKIMPDMLALIDFYLHKQLPTIARRLVFSYHKRLCTFLGHNTCASID